MGPPASLLMLDIDHFKKVNDTYGHQAGDVVLSNVAGLIRDTLRETDLFARYGGEEFVLLATGTEQDGALILAERLRTLIEGAVFTHGNNWIAVTISIGIGAWDASVKEDFEELIRRADSALYRAKEQGRNRYCT